MGELLNLVGLSAGVVLYAMLLAMVLRTAARPIGAATTGGVDPLLLVTAVLGLAWNLCALPAYGLAKLGVGGPFPLLIAIGFCALGLLPAVVVHSVLRGRVAAPRSVRRALIGVAYVVGAIAAVMQLRAALGGEPVPSALAMRLLTYTFVLLIAPLAAATRGQPGARRALWAAALATFAVSALHLSQLHRGDASWPVELLGHHASVPLAFAILYQDYPFALADIFLKRALALIALLAIAFAAIGVIGQFSPSMARLDPREISLVLSLWIATAFVYPALRAGISWFVDARVLHRPDYRSLRALVLRRLQTHDTVTPLLEDVCALLAPAMSARRVTWREWTGEEQTGAIAQGNTLGVIVATAETPRYLLTVAEVTGGRRLLSDDLETLDAVAVMAARRIDAIRITGERHARELREQEISKLATEAELRALRAQLNPHFLFNALTTIGYLIQTAPPRALDTLMRLTSLLRSVLRSEGEFTTLGRELEVVCAYLDIERARFEDRLRVSIDVPASLTTLRVPTLLLQPIVENAVKHGVSRQRSGGDVRVAAWADRTVAAGPQLVLQVTDTGSGATPGALARGRIAGVGLRNVERRIACQYGEAASLLVDSRPGIGTRVELRLPLQAHLGRSAPLEHVAS